MSTTDSLATGRQLRHELLKILMLLALHKRDDSLCELHVEQVVRMYGDSQTANATVNLDRIDLSLNGLEGEEVIIPQRRKHGRGARNHTCGLSIPNK